jgi:hypothetical protein
MAVITQKPLGLAAAAGEQALKRDPETGAWPAPALADEDAGTAFGQLEPTPGDAFKSVPREG